MQQRSLLPCVRAWPRLGLAQAGPGDQAARRPGFVESILTTRFLEQLADGHEDRVLEEAILRQEGVPVTPAELRARIPRIPPEQNAAVEYRKVAVVFEKAPDLDIGVISTPPPTAPGGPGAPPAVRFSAGPSPRGLNDYTQSDWDSARRAFRRHGDIVALIHRAALKPGCFFDRRWEDGTEMKFPEVPIMRRCERVLELESLLLARDGHVEEAVRTQALGFRIARHAGSDPCLLGHLVGLVCDSIALAGMNRILRMKGTDGRVAQAVRDVVARERLDSDPSRAMWGEIVMMGVTIDRFKARPSLTLSLASDGGSPSDSEARILDSPLIRPLMGRFLDASFAVILRWDRMLLLSLQEPTYLEQRAERRLQHLDNMNERTASDFNLVSVLAMTVVPVYTQSFANDAKMNARRQVLVAATAVLAFRVRHGAYPANLAQAAPHTIDPFSDGPLRYRREGSGFVVYSIGEAGKFTGERGAQMSQAERRQNLFFRYPEEHTRNGT